MSAVAPGPGLFFTREDNRRQTESGACAVNHQEDRYRRCVISLYGKRGYILDGRGITYHDRFLQEGAQLVLDDELVLHFTKPVSPEHR
jgi:hypothetical protein